VQEREREWGVTAIEAVGEMDAGPIWATVNFPMRAAAKGSLYRREVTEAAVQALLETVDRMRDPSFRPSRSIARSGRPAAPAAEAGRQGDRLGGGRQRSGARESPRRRRRTGVLDEVCGGPCHHDAHRGHRRQTARHGDRAA
jgi:putative two-component system hydrogenase maturation factor HypX/HoxX